MLNEIFDNFLKFIELMTQRDGVTKQEVCDVLGISVRTFYRYLEYFRNAGFNIVKTRQRFSFDASSPYFRQIMAFNYFSQEEINTILEIMEHSPRENERTEVLYRRLLQQKKWHIRNQHLIDKEYTEKVELLNTAISEKRMVILHNYSSVKSNTISDRIVEPYVFMGNNDSVRCYEHSTQTDKTFRLSRIGSVELMPINWIHEDRHGQVFTDAFNFSGERQFPVEICLNFRAVRLLVEEYPGCTPYVMRKSGTEWRLKMNVCDFRGIGRFCLGLFKDVKPIGSQAFLDYLNDNIAELQNLHYTIPERRN